MANLSSNIKSVLELAQDATLFKLKNSDELPRLCITEEVFSPNPLLEQWAAVSILSGEGFRLVLKAFFSPSIFKKSKQKNSDVSSKETQDAARDFFNAVNIRIQAELKKKKTPVASTPPVITLSFHEVFLPSGLYAKVKKNYWSTATTNQIETIHYMLSIETDGIHEPKHAV